VVLSQIERQIKEKIERVGTPLKDWDIQINYGIKTGFNEAFIIDGKKRQELINQDPKSAEIIRPILRGRDIKRYGYEFANLYLISTFPSLKIDIKQYPAVKNFLEGFKPKLKQTGELLTDLEKEQVLRQAKEQGIDVSEGDLKKSRKKTNNKWFETQDSISYWEDFYKQKICWKAVGRNLTFSLVEPGIFLTAPASFISSSHNEYILAFLCSNVGKYFVYQNSDMTGAGDIMLNIQSLVKFPIPRLLNEVENDIKNKIIALLYNLNNGLPIAEIQEELDAYIYKLYGFNQEEINAIEFV